MDDVVIGCLLQGASDMHGSAEGVTPVEHTRRADAPDHLAQILAFHVFHSEATMRTGLARRIDLHDVGMVDGQASVG